MKHVLPKWFYHKELKPEGKIIYKESELEALGPGWVESPADFDKEEVSQEDAEKLVESGEAEIPDEAVVDPAQEEIEDLKEKVKKAKKKKGN